jgi:hypothetical protein
VHPIKPDEKKRLYHPKRLEVGTNEIVNAERIFVTPKGVSIKYISVNNRLRCADIKALPYNPKRDDHMTGHYRVSLPGLMETITEHTCHEDTEADEAGDNSLAGAIEFCLYDKLCEDIVMIDCEGAAYCKNKPDAIELSSYLESARGLDFTIPVAVEECKKGVVRNVEIPKIDDVYERMAAKLGEQRIAEDQCPVGEVRFWSGRIQKAYRFRVARTHSRHRLLRLRSEPLWHPPRICGLWPS